MKRLVWCPLVIALCWPSLARAGGDPALLVLPHSPLAAPDGVFAIATNPAGLASVQEAELGLAASSGVGLSSGLAERRFGAFGAAGAGPVRLGYALQGGQTALVGGPEDLRLRHDVAVGLGALGLGWRRWARVGEVAGSPSAWIVGLQGAPLPYLALGARASFADADARALGIGSGYAAGVAVRPWADGVITVGLEGGAQRDPAPSAGSWLAHAAASVHVRVLDGVQVGLDSVWRQVSGAQDVFTTGVSLRVAPTAHATVGIRGAIASPATDAVETTVAVKWTSAAAPSLSDREPRGVVVPLAGAMGESAAAGGPVFSDLLGRLARVRQTRGVRLIVLRDEGLSLDWAQAEELRAVAQELRAEGRKLVYQARALTGRTYAVASACDAIVLRQGGVFNVKGVTATAQLLKKGLDMLGVQVETVRYGAFKTAPESYTEEALSDAMRAQLTAIVEQRWASLLRWTADRRGKKEAEALAALSEGPAFPGHALSLGLVDAVLHDDEVEAWLRKQQLLPEGAALRTSTPAVAPRWGQPQRIAVLALDAAMADGKGGRSLLGGRQIGAETWSATLDALSKRRDVVGIVIRISSPGGSVSASERMHRAVERAASRKPLVVSMGSVAASGGYYAAAAAPLVLADAATVTGSIGIFAAKPSIAGLWAKLGVGRFTEERGPLAGVESLDRPWTPAEREAVAKGLRRYYDLFLERVAAGRKLEKATVEASAEGRVFTGSVALERKLVDRIGGLQDAIREVAKRAGVDLVRDRVQVVSYPKLGLLEELRRRMGLPSLEGGRADEVEALRDALGLGVVGPVLTAPPLEPMAYAPLDP